jgi:hypothetical protein
MNALAFVAALLLLLCDTVRVSFGQGNPGDRPSPVGTGLDGLVYWSTELPFLDIFKTSGLWFSGSADMWEDHRPLDLDAHGWVRSLSDGQQARTLMMFGEPMWVDSVPRFPLGQYTVEYEGEGTIQYYRAHVVRTAPGRDVIELDPQVNEGLGLSITSVNPRNYIRNIRVIRPNDAPPGEIFNPTFLERLRGYKVIRFTGWMFGPSEADPALTPHTWSTRPTLEDARWESSRRGAPVEIMTQLVNLLGADAWFTIPHLADDEFVRRFAETVRNSLDPALKVYVEHSNEVWNSLYPQYAFATERGLALGLSTDPGEARNRYHALRTRQIGEIFEQVLGKSRVVKVLATFTEMPDLSEQALAWNHTAAYVDALAVAPYFGYELGVVENEPRVQAMTLDELFRELETRWLPDANGYTVQQAAIARRYNLPLISYEGGQHLARVGNVSSERVDPLFDAANRDPRMGGLYARYLEDWSRATGGQLFVHLMNCGESGRAGRWGALEYIDQPRSRAPKYDAIQTFMGH